MVLTVRNGPTISWFIPLIQKHTLLGSILYRFLPLFLVDCLIRYRVVIVDNKGMTYLSLLLKD